MADDDGAVHPDPANINLLATQWRLFGDQIGALESTVNRIIGADFPSQEEYNQHTPAATRSISTTPRTRSRSSPMSA